MKEPVTQAKTSPDKLLADQSTAGPLGQPTLSRHSTQARRLLAIFAVALVIRLLFCFVVVPIFDLAMGPAHPSFHKSNDGYLNLAVNLVEHGRFTFSPNAASTTFRPPLYPMILALVYAATGQIALAALLVNCLASAATCVVAYLIAQFLLGHRPPLYVIVPLLVFPLSLRYCATAFSETFYTLTYTAYVLTLMYLVRQPSLGTGLLNGLALAAAVLSRSIVLPFAFVVLGYAILRRRSLRMPVLVSTILGLALTSGWTIRNYLVSGHFIPVSVGPGYNMLVGNFMVELHRATSNEIYTYGKRHARQHLNLAPADLKTGEHYDISQEIDQKCGRAAREMFMNDPTLLVRKVVINSLRFWYLSTSVEKCVFHIVVNGAIVILAAIWFIRSIRSWAIEIGLLVVFTLFIMVAYSAIIVSGVRFSLPVLLMLTPLAAAAIGDFALRGKNKGMAASTST